MLVLSRRVNEVLCIGPDIEVEVLGIMNGQVRLGIRAPKSVRIDRKEKLPTCQRCKKMVCLSGSSLCWQCSQEVDNVEADPLDEVSAEVIDKITDRHN